ncbi:hypothetical protein TNCV_19251 [Trichonephila clavipes]|nr:hypothetical protein TNCV_19251 [Trichonephila clavipes]
MGYRGMIVEDAEEGNNRRNRWLRFGRFSCRRRWVGKSCASVDADNLVTVGILKNGIVGFKTADKGESRNVFARRKDFVCRAEFVSSSRSPERNRLTDFGSPPIPTRAFCIKKGDFFPISLCSSESSKNLAEKRRRRIPFDFQRTSLVGLALDSATSSGLGRAPALQCRTPSRHHLKLQDRRDYTPADRAARTCWLGCPGLLYYLAA